ncbi:MAG TPA: NBR1-Ig-like domain-containing protein [Anaerolineales bacterium]|nr:NBR1-Ig-like domain-containing protein [Anaerolineales bacterium]
MGRPFFMMTTRLSHSRSLFALLLSLFSVSAFACSPAPTPTPFRPPTLEPPLIEPTLIIQPTKQPVIIQSTPLPTITPAVDPQDCVSDLGFLSDITIPDNTFVTYGSSIDKQWLVENNGTCNWDSSYRLRHLGGAVLGAPEETLLYPARSGKQATIQIIFTAPFTDGFYESAWQAYDPAGIPFGDPIYIRITVASP